MVDIFIYLFYSIVFVLFSQDSSYMYDGSLFLLYLIFSNSFKFCFHFMLLTLLFGLNISLSLTIFFTGFLSFSILFSFL